MKIKGKGARHSNCFDCAIPMFLSLLWALEGE
jgi:hypothetical protein